MYLTILVVVNITRNSCIGHIKRHEVPNTVMFNKVVGWQK
jgi:hypothetical protein